MEMRKRSNQFVVFAVLFAVFALLAVSSGADPGIARLKIVATYFAFVAALSLVAGLLVVCRKAKLVFHLNLYYAVAKNGEVTKSLFPQCAHGPQTWPLWRLVSMRLGSLNIEKPSTGHRLWVYTRRGSFSVDVIFDRHAHARAKGTVCRS